MRLVHGTTLCAVVLTAAPAASADVTIIQYFESKWDSIRYRMPDIFIAGYDGVWLPPPQRAAAGAAGIGYDLFDRFDLGTDASPTRYGSESGLRLMIEQFHRASAYVYVDWLMNHNAAWDNTSSGDPFLNNGQSFIQNGGYPGFALSYAHDAFGDFNNYVNPCPQSTNPGGGCYDLFNGRLLGLIDIDVAQAGPLYEWIRHPVAVSADNLPMPPTAVRNLPNAANVRLYPDRDLPGYMPLNPGTSRNPGPPNYTFYPYNTAEPAQGDAVKESAAFLLLRATQYYLEVLGVDGFRLDAAKHMPTWFWDNLWDAAVHNRWVDFDGNVKIPYSFSEAVESNNNTVNWVRKPGENGGPGWPAAGWQFGNRDALDLNEAGQLRDIIGAAGTGSWDNVLGASVDNVDDGFNNGTIGVHHVTSHDNSFPNEDITAQAYVLLRTGPCVVYHNALEFGPVSFPRPDSRKDAIGLGSSHITTLVRLRQQYGRGYFIPLNSNRADVMVFTRRSPGSEDNVLVGVNDSHANGVNTLNVTTAFPQGTRLHEQTGNAADPLVDPLNVIPEVITVGAGGAINNLAVPRQRNSNGTFHGRGYVVYGPAVPTGTLSIVNAATSVAPPDTAGTADPVQRVNPVTIVTSPTFDLQLQTVHTDPLDPNTDDLAVFRIDSGFADDNGNGGVDHLTPGSPSYGFEDFLTDNSPRFTGGTGLYRQTIDAAALGEGYHFITVRAFRHRPTGTQPLFGEFRMAIYVDLAEPDFDLVAPSATCNADITSLPVNFVVKAADTSVDRVHIFVDLQEDTDFVAKALQGTGRATRSFDTFTLTRGSLLAGNHRVDVVAFETLPNGSTRVTHKSYTGIQSLSGSSGPADVNHDGQVNINDVTAFLFWIMANLETFEPAADMNCDGYVDGADIQAFVDAVLGV